MFALVAAFVFLLLLEGGLANSVAGKSQQRAFQFPRGPSRGNVVPSGASGFGVVLDAGSSGTRIHVYVWEEEHTEEGAEGEAEEEEEEEEEVVLPAQGGSSGDLGRRRQRRRRRRRPLLQEVRIPGPGPVGFAWNKQHKPAIASLEGKPELAGKALEPLLEHAKEIILAQPGVGEEDAEVVLSSVPVILGATGGMRMLSPEAAEAIMESAREVLRASAFLFKDEWARIISGEEEVGLIRGPSGLMRSRVLFGTTPRPPLP